MTRTTARQLALQLSFAVSAGSDIGPEDFFEEEYFRALPPEENLFDEVPDDKQKEYILSLVNGVRLHQAEPDLPDSAGGPTLRSV